MSSTTVGRTSHLVMEGSTLLISIIICVVVYTCMRAVSVYPLISIKFLVVAIVLTIHTAITPTITFPTIVTTTVNTTMIVPVVFFVLVSLAPLIQAPHHLHVCHHSQHKSWHGQIGSYSVCILRYLMRRIDGGGVIDGCLLEMGGCTSMRSWLTIFLTIIFSLWYPFFYLGIIVV